MIPILAISTLFLAITVECQVIRPDCQEKCGSVNIPYPFGIGKNCALDGNFVIFCNDVEPGHPKPVLAGHGSLDIIDISLNGTLRKYTYVASDCYARGGKSNHSNTASSRLHKFFYSATRNRFTAVGCDTYARLTGSAQHQQYRSGCMSICYNESSVTDGSCSGIGCCQSSIPKQLSEFNVVLKSYYGHAQVWDFNPCSYALMVDASYFNFSTKFLQNMSHTVPTVLDWAIGYQNCTEAKKNTTSYACIDHNSYCQNSDNGPGYRCFCSSGYRGNPYINGGCADVNECEDQNLNDCTHRCHNVVGRYTCSCPKWFRGDGKRNGKGCSLDQDRIIHVIIGIGILLILLAAGSCLLHSYRRKQMHIRCKENFFKQNGGTILQDRIDRSDSSINTVKIFKIKELEVATDNFNERRICGEGGFGTVYKGHLSDGNVVAIKKSKAVDVRQKEQFINEIMVLSQIKHQNVVRFLGCCFETPQPLLVYEFIPNGTLSDHIHNNGSIPRMSWSTRLNIAAETAGVLAYLHSEHSPPVIHRDIKPTNILLDDNYSSKVSDFGCSRLISKNENEMCTMVQGTLGYLDPEYLQTGQLTEKSDVYSFGVVLIELLTALKAASFERFAEGWTLVNYFLSLMNDNSILEILDKGIVNEDNAKEIMEVANIAKACVAVKGEERPRMNEVAGELQGLLTMLKHKWATENLNREETESLLGDVPADHCGSSIPTSVYTGTVEGFMALNIDGGR